MAEIIEMREDVPRLRRLMINAMADLRVTGGGLSEILCHACFTCTGRIELVKVITSTINDENRHSLNQPPHISTGLHIAVHKEYMEMARHLLEVGVDVNGAGSLAFESPLQLVVRLGRMEMTRLLFEKGVNPEAVDLMGRTPRMLVERMRDAQLKKVQPTLKRNAEEVEAVHETNK